MKTAINFGRGSSRRSPRPSSWWGGFLPLPKNPTPALGLRPFGLGPFT